MVERIKQRDEDDCQMAVCAMLSDEHSYDDLKEIYGRRMNMHQIICLLREEGFFYSPLRCQRPQGVLDHAHHVDKIYIVMESPISEKNPELYREFCVDSGRFDVYHAVAIVEGEVLDPKPEPYWETWRDLFDTPYEMHSACAFREEQGRQVPLW